MKGNSQDAKKWPNWFHNSRSRSRSNNSEEAQSHLDKQRDFLSRCVLQTGLHHTQMALVTYNGQMLLQQNQQRIQLELAWYRTDNSSKKFLQIPAATKDWYQPSADDIGAQLLVRLKCNDEGGQFLFLERGPVVEDPSVRTQVENILAKHVGIFMGLVRIQDDCCLDCVDEPFDKWTLLFDDKRIRIISEDSLVPPVEALYCNDTHIVLSTINSTRFTLFLNYNTPQIELCAANNIDRDIIVLSIRAFCNEALQSGVLDDAVMKGKAPMLTAHTLNHGENQHNGNYYKDEVTKYMLPWSKKHDLNDEFVKDKAALDSLDSLSFDTALLNDVDALIGNASGTGVSDGESVPSETRDVITKLKKELENMTVERDFWQKEARKYKSQLANE